MKDTENDYKLISEACTNQVNLKINSIVRRFMSDLELIENKGRYIKEIDVMTPIESFLDKNKDGKLSKEDFEWFMGEIIHINYSEEMFKQEINILKECLKKKSSQKTQ